MRECNRGKKKPRREARRCQSNEDFFLISSRRRIYATGLSALLRGVVVVEVGNVGGTAQRNVARGELAARPVSLTRDGLRRASPFAAPLFLLLYW